MPEFNVQTISLALDTQIPELEKAYADTIRDIINAWTQRGVLRKVFLLEENNDNLEITFNHLSLKVFSQKKFIFVNNKLFASLSFVYKVKDEFISIFECLISIDGMIIIGEIANNEILDFRHNDVGYELFNKLAQSANSKRIISI